MLTAASSGRPSNGDEIAAVLDPCLCLVRLGQCAGLVAKPRQPLDAGLYPDRCGNSYFGICDLSAGAVDWVAVAIGGGVHSAVAIDLCWPLAAPPNRTVVLIAQGLGCIR